MNKQEIEKALSWFEPELNSQESAYAFAIANGQDTDKRFEDWLGYMRTAVECMGQQLTGGWIPVTERLPEKNGNYIVTVLNTRNKSITMVSSWQATFGLFEIEDTYQKVTAWMPLPEPWKEGE